MPLTTARDTGPRFDQDPSDDRDTTAIVGGGCAGVLVAAHLMRADRRARHIVIFEPRAELGAGMAYATDDQRHLLNAPAGSMSAFEDDPGHFVTWLAARGSPWQPTDFVPRPLYREYLQDVLHHTLAGASSGTQLTWVHESVTSVTVGHERPVTTVGFGPGRRCRADNVVLAVGAPAPVALPALGVSPGAAMIGDPWSPGALDAVPTDGDVLILGTGLTMVDIALVLTDRDPRRTVHARSRHGLLPAEHTDDGFAPWPAFDIGRPASARQALHRLRRMTVEAEADGWNWRNVIAAARTAAPEVWAGLALPEQQRLLRHLGRRWEVARHRMSAPVAGAVGDLRRRGRLTVGAGRVVGVSKDGSVGRPRLRVTLAGPGGRHETMTVGALLDCTGPGPDPTVGSPLVAALVADGLARIHPSGIGLDVDDHGALRSGSTTGPVHTVGWCRRGSEFEATAVPEIRQQVRRLVTHLAVSSGRPVPVLVSA